MNIFQGQFEWVDTGQIAGMYNTHKEISNVCTMLCRIEKSIFSMQGPTCEYFPTQAVLTNCLGVTNIVRAIEENGYPVDTVLTVSIDNACPVFIKPKPGD